MVDMDFQTVFEGKIIRVVEKKLPSGNIREIAVRPPGTRIIIHRKTDNCILLTKEIRLDIGEDVRLPGGKVRDLIVEWDGVKNDPHLDNVIIEAAAKEVREEAGIEAKDLKIISISTSGGPTVDWTLYYLVSSDFTEIGHQELEVDEKISTIWVPIEEVREICLSGKMKEGRSVAVMLQYLHSIGLLRS